MQRIVSWWKQLDITRLRVTILAVLLITGFSFAFIEVWMWKDWQGFLLNLGTELIGAGLTFFLIDQVLRQRERSEEEKQAEAFSKAELIARLGSSVQSFAVAAAEELRRRGWLTDGSLNETSLLAANLQNAPLSYGQLFRTNLGDANLQQADMSHITLQGAHLDGAKMHGAYMLGANLQEASLVSAKLSGADLREANLKDAELIMTNLKQANLRQARLSEAVLSNANLQEAILQQANLNEAYCRGADLRGCNMQGAIVQGAVLDEAVFDEHTILPNGSHWTPNINIRHFTHPAGQTHQTMPGSTDDLLESFLYD